MLMTLIGVIIVIAAFALVYWGLTQVALPQPIKVVLIVVFGLIALAIVYNWVIAGGGHLALPRM